MATLHLSKSTTVNSLRKEFNETFGSQVKVYNGRSVADENMTLSETGLTREGDFECRSSLTVASFIARMMDEFGLKVKVYTCDEWVACLDGLTLESTGKVKKNAVKADMESMIAYKKEVAESNEFYDEDEIDESPDDEFSVDGIEYTIINNSASAYYETSDSREVIVVPDNIDYQGTLFPVVDIELSIRGDEHTLELGKNLKFIIGGRNELCKFDHVIAHSPKGYLESGLDDFNVLEFFKVPIQYDDHNVFENEIINLEKESADNAETEAKHKCGFISKIIDLISGD